MYRISDQAAPLANLRVDVNAETAAAHETMRDRAQAACNAHNRAIDLMRGEGDFAAAWEALPAGADGAPVYGDPGLLAPLVESLCIELRSRQSPYTALDADLVRDRVMRIAQADPAHPVAAHWQVLHARSYPMHDAPPEWAELAQYLAARAVLDSGPQVGQACSFYPADGRAPIPGRVTRVWGATTVNLEFADDAGATSVANSVQVVMAAAEGDRYVCVLLPA